MTDLEPRDTDDDSSVVKDAAYYNQVQRSIGRGTPTLLLGTSTRSLKHSVERLIAAQSMEQAPTYVEPPVPSSSTNLLSRRILALIEWRPTENWRLKDQEIRRYAQQAARSISVRNELAKLADLRDRGVVTDKEFDRLKVKTEWRAREEAKRRARGWARREDQDFRSYVQEAARSISVRDQLAELADLRDRGVITDEEFDRAKARAEHQG